MDNLMKKDTPFQTNFQRTFLTRLFSTRWPSRPTNEVCQVIADDPATRALLAMLATELFSVPPLLTTAPVQHNTADLAAFIDLETIYGTLIATHEYPHIWWQLWTDLDLAEVYYLTRSEEPLAEER